MSQKAPGKSHRQGLSFLKAADMFSTEEKAQAWVESERWPNGAYCPRCGSFDVVRVSHPSQSHRCKDCRKAGEKRTQFSVRTGTVMERTKLKYRTWAIGIYLYATNIKGVSSMRLHRELGITQKSAWFMLQRLRKAAEAGNVVFRGPIEVDETFVGGIRKNMSNEERKALAGTGRGTVGKIAVAGVKDRETNQVSAEVVDNTDKDTLQKFVVRHVQGKATVYSDDAEAYRGLPFPHETVKHSVSEYVRNKVIHTNGIESFWSMLKRGYKGIYHKMSPKHLNRYVKEFQHRHNIRELNTIDQMGAVVVSMQGKRLKYTDLVADNGLPNFTGAGK